MKDSRRIKRMARRKGTITKMNLTSLMDVFTILVFFLLVNSGTAEVLETPKQVVLPESKVEVKPRETVVIFIGKETVIVQGDPVITIADVLNSKEADIQPINDRLAEVQKTVIGRNTKEVSESQEITILADKTTPFTVIQKVMATCTQQGYERLSLAVIQKNGTAQI
jgi:biopolymer transport protein ExbD